MISRYLWLLGLGFVLFYTFLSPLSTTNAQTDFNPHFIISDEEVQDFQSWGTNEVQKFLDSKGGYLRTYRTKDQSGTLKTASEIITTAAQSAHINPKFLLVMLQREASLITDDNPSATRLDWATGYQMCDSCSVTDPTLSAYKGFSIQVTKLADWLRRYLDHKDEAFIQEKSYIKKKGVLATIDNQEVIPQSWATAFLYTYTPHLHGNLNFWRIWNTWFKQNYPNGSLLQAQNSNDVWLLRNGVRSKFKNKAALISRADPHLIIRVPEIELTNYPLGPEISFPNFSLLHTPDGKTYLLDDDVVRLFENEQVVRQFGYNPQEIIDISAEDLAPYSKGPTISNSSTAPTGAIYQISDLNNALYYMQEKVLYPILDSQLLQSNFKSLILEKHRSTDIVGFTIANEPIKFKDGTLLQIKGRTPIYVIDRGMRRPIADEETFSALGYAHENVKQVELTVALTMPEGEPLFLNTTLLSAKNKFLGDSEQKIADLFHHTSSTAYLVAEYPSGHILSGKNIDSPHPIASLTKLLTGYEALEQGLKLNESTAYERKKYQIGGKELTLAEGEKISHHDTLYAMLTASVNNLAKMLPTEARLSESELVQRIQKRLTLWGADHTSLEEITGLSAKNQSTPRDLLKIFTFILKNPTIKSALSHDFFTLRGNLKNKKTTHIVKNSNPLFFTKKKYTILASKTGYTEEAGTVVVMLIESKTPIKKQYIIITLGNHAPTNRFEEINALSEWVINQKAVNLSK